MHGCFLFALLLLSQAFELVTVTPLVGGLQSRQNLFIPQETA
jgi:hypothetical protein